MLATEALATSSTARVPPRIARIGFHTWDLFSRPCRAIPEIADDLLDRGRSSLMIPFVETGAEAEGVGFEPTRHFCPPVFKTGSIGRSDSPPGSQAQIVAYGPGVNLEHARRDPLTGAPPQNFSSSRATPSSRSVRVNSFPAAFTSRGAWPIATPRPEADAHSSMSISLRPSPTAIT